MTEENPKLRENALEVLVGNKFFQNIVAGNEIKQNPMTYGQLGFDIGEKFYSDSLQGDNAEKLRKGLYKEKEEERRNLGIAETAPYPTNYDVVKKILSSVNESFAVLSLGDLESAVTKISGKLDFSIPEKLKSLSQMDLIPKLSSKVELSEDEETALKLIQLYKEAYTKSLVLKSISSGYLDGINEVGKKITEKYNKED